MEEAEGKEGDNKGGTADMAEAERVEFSAHGFYVAVKTGDAKRVEAYLAAVATRLASADRLSSGRRHRALLGAICADSADIFKATNAVFAMLPEYAHHYLSEAAIVKNREVMALIAAVFVAAPPIHEPGKRAVALALKWLESGDPAIAAQLVAIPA